MKFTALAMDTPVDYHIAQYAAKPDLKKNMNSSEVYLVAAHREWNSYMFYTGLAEAQPAGEVKEMLLQMANQELKHKEKVEYLYSNTAFPQTAGG
jgi:rubrerythrin